MLHLLDATFAGILRSTIPAAAIIAAVLLLRLILNKKLSPAWWCALWLIAGARFVVPTIPVSLIPSAWLPNQRTSVSQSQAQSAATAATIQANSVVRIAYSFPMLIASPATTSSPRGFPIRRILALIWLAGALSLFVRRLIGELKLARTLGLLAPVTDSRTVQILLACSGQLNLRRRIRVLRTDRVKTPAVAGIFRPVLLLPTAFVESASDHDLRLVILHELVHVKRCDVLVDRVVALVRILHWFNPAAWLWSRLYSADRELAADSAVLRCVRPDDRDAYAHCLLNMIQRLSAISTTLAPPLPATIGMFHPKANLKRRITMISAFTDSASRRRFSTLLGSLVFLAVGCAALSGQSQPATSTSDTEQKVPAAPKTASPISAAPTSNVEMEAPVSVPERNLLVTLDRKLPEVSFDAVPLTDAIDKLRDITGTNIFVNWQALQSAGIDNNAPVSVHLHDISFKKAIEVILADAGGGTVKLGFAPDDGVLTISTEENLSQKTLTRVYDVRDLLAQGADFMPGKRTTTSPSTGTRADDLVQLIVDTVAPDSWRQAGGTVGSIRELSGQLIITQTPANHEIIATLLNNLHQSRGTEIFVELRLFIADPTAMPPAAKNLLDSAIKESRPIPIASARAEALVHDLSTVKTATILAAPRVVVFNGQRAMVTAGRDTSYISGFAAIKKPDGEIRFEPQSASVTSGVELQVSATSEPARTAIRLDIGARLTKLLGLSSSKWAGSDIKDLLVQTPILAVYSAPASVSVPADNSVLISAAPNPTFTGPSAATTQSSELLAPNQRLFLLVKPALLTPPSANSRAQTFSAPPADR